MSRWTSPAELLHVVGLDVVELHHQCAGFGPFAILAEAHLADHRGVFFASDIVGDLLLVQRFAGVWPGL